MSRPKMEPVNSSYGAPMGRWESSDPPTGRIRLFRVVIDMEGYDDGGAYWGLGKPLFKACDDDENFRQFLRATDREHAKQLLAEMFPDYDFAYRRAR